MGTEQIRMNQTKALPPASQFNWSQMESSPLLRDARDCLERELPSSHHW